MAVGYRTSSISAGNAYVTSVNVPVPTGAASGDVALVCLSMWETANPTVTPPTGFTLVTTVVNSEMKLKLFWKRLTGADTGNYAFSWTGSQWTDGQAILITGAVATGDPIGTQFSSSTGSTTAIGSISTTSVGQPFLAQFSVNDSSATGTPPTGFTEVQDQPYNRTNYRIPGTTGSQTASGATLSVSTAYSAILVAVEPAAGGSPARTSDFMSFFQ